MNAIALSAVECIVPTPSMVGESPVWDSGESALFWVDIPGRRIHRWSSSEGATRAWILPQMVGAIARTTSGQWLAAMETAIVRVELGDGEHARLLDDALAVPHPEASMRCNDGRCDRSGRFLVSTMFNDMSAGKPLGRLFSAGKAGISCILEKPLIVGNGLAFSNNGGQMYLSDSHPDRQVVWRFDYDCDTGLPTRPAVFADFKPLPGRPDGAAIDVDDCYWICANDGAAVYRFTPDGRLDQTVPLPVKKPSMCAFGGSQLDTLFITSIRPQGIDISDQPLAGCVFAVKTSTQGLEEPCFRY